jgi:hypothetical protein
VRKGPSQGQIHGILSHFLNLYVKTTKKRGKTKKNLKSWYLHQIAIVETQCPVYMYISYFGEDGGILEI